jgi:glycosyltransferase involved in cell wall biosynthesis
VGAPLVFTHHTRFRDYGHYLGPLARLGSTAVERYLRSWWASCAAIVAPGSELADEIRGALGQRRRPIVRTIPTGIDLAWIRGLTPAEPRGRAGWASDTTVVVSVGRLAPEKSVELLADAFLEAAARDPRLRLLLVGGGPLEARLRALAARDTTAGRIHLAGPLPRAEALALASGADLFAFASQTETQGLVLSEALACGLPVVALAAPGVRDAVRDGVDGTLVAAEPASDRIERLASAIGAVAGDAERRGAMARAAVEGAARFDHAARIAEIVALYRDAAARRR